MPIWRAGAGLEHEHIFIFSGGDDGSESEQYGADPGDRGRPRRPKGSEAFV